jgi:hypothetical protein
MLGVDADVRIIEEALEEIATEDEVVRRGERGILDKEFSVIHIFDVFGYDCSVLEEEVGL